MATSVAAGVLVPETAGRGAGTSLPVGGTEEPAAPSPTPQKNIHIKYN